MTLFLRMMNSIFSRGNRWHFSQAEYGLILPGKSTVKVFCTTPLVKKVVDFFVVVFKFFCNCHFVTIKYPPYTFKDMWNRSSLSASPKSIFILKFYVLLIIICLLSPLFHLITCSKFFTPYFFRNFWVSFSYCPLLRPF